MKNTPWKIRQLTRWPISSIMCGDYKNRSALWLVIGTRNNGSLSRCVLTKDWPILLHSFQLLNCHPQSGCSTDLLYLSLTCIYLYFVSPLPTIVHKDVMTTSRALLTLMVVTACMMLYHTLIRMKVVSPPQALHVTALLMHYAFMKT